MKVLVLLLGAIAITEASHGAKVKHEAEELRNTINQDESTLQTFDGEFGVVRKMRLQKIADHFRKKQEYQSDEDREAIKLFYENYVPVNISTFLPARDPYTINKAAGISEYLFQGDIDLTNEQLDEIERQLEDVDANGRSKRQITSILTRKWTNNRVPYYFDSSASDRLKSLVKYSLNYLQSKTCITFQENSAAANKIKVWTGAGCLSKIGMTKGEQPLSLSNGCLYSGTVIHEFMHALGVFHMHMRSDRDQYVTVDGNNYSEEFKTEFIKLRADENINYTPYEYGSVMSYTAPMFGSGNRFPVVPKDPAYLYTMGGRLTTFYDIDKINEHYGCNAKCPKSSMCKNGGKPNPNNCNVCNCPEGYGGNYCDQRPSGCGADLTATSTWKNQTVYLGNTFSQRDIADVCNYWVRAPAGYKIELKLVDTWDVYCLHGCQTSAIEFKVGDQVATNPRICCDEFLNKSHISKLNPTPVILYNDFGVAEYTFSYRMVPGTVAQPTQQEEAC